MRTSKPTERVLDVLEYVAEQGSAGATLSDIARGASAPKATVLGIVNTLEERGYLTRGTDRRLRLGAAAARLLEGYVDRDAVLEEARRLLTVISARFGVACTATCLRNDRIEIAVCTGAEHSPEYGDTEGQSFAFGNGSGFMFVAWRSDAEVRRWIASLDQVSPAVEERTLQLARACREQGYWVRNIPRRMVLHRRLIRDLQSASGVPISLRNELTDALRYMVDDPALEGDNEDVAYVRVSAPVFDSRAGITLTISALIRSSDCEAVEADVIAAVLQTSRHLTNQRSGTDPWADGIVEPTTVTSSGQADSNGPSTAGGDVVSGASSTPA